MLDNYKFPKDFSDRVTLLLSEPRDFSKRGKGGGQNNHQFDYIRAYGNSSAARSWLYDKNGKFDTSNLLSKANSGDKNAQRILNNLYENGFDVQNLTEDSYKSGLDNLKSYADQQHSLNQKKIQNNLARENMEGDAIDKARYSSLPFHQKIAHNIAKSKGEAFDPKSQDTISYISENAGDYLKTKSDEIGKIGSSVKENAPKLFDSLTGFKGSKKTQELKAQRAESVGHAAQNVVQSRIDQIRKSNPNMSKDDMDKYRAKMEKFYSKGGSKAVSKEEQRLGEKFDKDNAKQIQKAKDRDSTLRARKIMGGIQGVGTAIDSGLDMVSSKHRAQTLATQGHAGIARKQARLAQLLGDKSLTTRIVAGNWGGSLRTKWGEGMGFGGIAGSVLAGGVDRLNPISNKIRSNEAAYEKSARYFSEQENLSWQPEEYAKLRFFLEKEYENPEDFSEQDQEQPFDGQGFYDASKEVDISSLTPEAAEKLLNKSYYAVAEDEKKYQESIAKGFSEEYNKQKTYENFLNECAEVYDMSAWR